MLLQAMFSLDFFRLLKVADITTLNNTPSSVMEVIQCSDVFFKIEKVFVHCSNNKKIQA